MSGTNALAYFSKVCMKKKDKKGFVVLAPDGKKFLNGKSFRISFVIFFFSKFTFDFYILTKGVFPFKCERIFCSRCEEHFN